MSNIKSRVSILFLTICSLYLILLGNLAWIQIVQHEFYTSLAKRQYEVNINIHPPRAMIFDRHGLPLAINHDALSAFILPKQITHKKELISFLATHFPAAYTRLQQQDPLSNQHFMFVKRHLKPDEIKLIEQSGIGDIQLLSEPTRYYPHGTTAGIVGFVDIDNQGLAGIELTCNQQLSGTNTTCMLERDARSGHFHFAKQLEVMGNQGIPITLSIDSTLQFLCMQELEKAMQTVGSQRAAAIIINPCNGEILTLATLPTFDPANLSDREPEKTNNFAVCHVFELGSVMKICASLAALDEKVVTLDEPIDCQNAISGIVEGRRVNTVKSSVQDIIPFKEVIARSNNIGIATVTCRLGSRLYDHYIRMGLSSKTGIQLPGEQAGFVNDPAHWSAQSIISLSYGYEASLNLLQLGRIFCMIARDGIDVPLTIIKTPQNATGKRIYDSGVIAQIKEILEYTTQVGSTKKAQIAGYRIMSKTGTANMLINGQYDTTRNLFSCAGIIQKDEYQRVLIIFMQDTSLKNQFASTIAAPVFEKIAQKLLIHEKIIA